MRVGQSWVSERRRGNWLCHLHRYALEVAILSITDFSLWSLGGYPLEDHRHVCATKIMPITKVKLARDFYTRPNVLQVARDLLGKLLVVPTLNGKRVSGMIVETEAYRIQKIALHTLTVDDARNAPKRCTNSVDSPTSISFMACTTSSTW